MTDFQLKFKLIFLRFLIIQAAFIVVYSFFNWYVFMQRDWLHLHQDVADFAIPGVLAFIPVIVFLLPRLRLLDFSQKKGKNPIAGGVIIAFFATAVTTLTLQNYLLTATGKLTSLQNIGQINQLPKTKYYTIKQHYADIKDNYVYDNRYVSGKGNTRLNFDAYIVFPIYNSVTDTAQIHRRFPHVWLGVCYSKTISNRISQTEKEQAYTEFKANTMANFMSRSADDFVYLDRLGKSQRSGSYKRALGLFDSDDSASLMFFEAHNQPFANRNGNKLWWVLLAFAGGGGMFVLVLAGTPLDKQKVAALRPPDPGDFNNWKS
ncbi:MAG: hypothetical protein V4592_05660 [Bacteroidota bacterium]